MLIVIKSCFTIGGSKRDQGACLAQLIKLAANNTHAQSPRPAVQPKIKIWSTSFHFGGEGGSKLSNTDQFLINSIGLGANYGVALAPRRWGWGTTIHAIIYKWGRWKNWISTLYISVASTCKFLQFSSHHFLDKGPDECDGSSWRLG